eukprot:1159670-Pelagomonas_calceolata.AAC.2
MDMKAHLLRLEDVSDKSCGFNMALSIDTIEGHVLQLGKLGELAYVNLLEARHVCLREHAD